MFPSYEAIQVIGQYAFTGLRANARPVEISGLNTDEFASAAS